MEDYDAYQALLEDEAENKAIQEEEAQYPHISPEDEEGNQQAEAEERKNDEWAKEQTYYLDRFQLTKQAPSGAFNPERRQEMTNLETQILILKAKAFAQERYNQGLDFFVECYTDEEWVEYIQEDKYKNWKELKAGMLKHAAIIKERAEEINASEW